jgi:hypothetical protein
MLLLLLLANTILVQLAFCCLRFPNTLLPVKITETLRASDQGVSLNQLHIRFSLREQQNFSLQSVQYGDSMRQSNDVTHKRDNRLALNMSRKGSVDTQFHSKDKHT